MPGTTNDATRGRGRGTRRQLNRRSNEALRGIAGRRLPFLSLLRHVGRRSGRPYVTPLTAYPLGDGFVLALLYGDSDTVDWCRNVMSAGSCTLVWRGRENRLERPEIIPASRALAAFPLPLRLLFRVERIQQFLWAHGQGNFGVSAAG